MDDPRRVLSTSLFFEPFALSPDTRQALQAMGYVTEEQSPWGAVELIATAAAGRAEAVASSGNDAAAGSAVRPGLLYGATDSRRPSGAAVTP